MVDNITTMRSEYYKRRKPGVGSRAKPIKWSEQTGFYKLDPKNREELLEQDKLNQMANAFSGEVLPDIAPWFPKIPTDPRVLERRRAMMEANPWLAPLLAEAAKARYDLFTGDQDYYKSKKYGWGEYWNAPPDDDEYFTWGRDNDGKLVPIPSDKAKELEQTNPDLFAFRRKPFADYDEDKAFQLVPMTREEADEDKLPWYASTNDYLNAILATRLGEDNRQALYDEAQDALGEYVSDLVKSGAIDQEKANAILAEAAFRPENAFVAGAKNLVTPARHAVTSDPELLKKTGKDEMRARTVADAGLGALSLLLPWGMAARGAMYSSRPLLGAALGGFAGGVGSYAAERGANQLFDTAYGYGIDNQPIDLVDAGLAGLGGALIGPGMAAPKVRGWKNVRKMMNPREPQTVTYGDVKSSFKASKASPDDITKASRSHATSAMDQYKKQFTSGAMKVETAPALQANGIPLAQDMPLGKLSDLIKSRQGEALRLRRGVGDEGGFLLGTNPSDRITVGVGTEGNTVLTKDLELVPPKRMFWEDAQRDPRFVKQMVAENPEYYADFTMEDIEKGLPRAAKAAQTKGSTESNMFGKGEMVLNNDEFAKLLSAFAGNPIDEGEKIQQRFLQKMLSKKSTPGAVKDGKFVEGSDKQKKLYKKGLTDYKRRANQKVVSESQAKDMMGNTKGDIVGKVGLGLVQPVMRNVVPFGSNYIFGVQPTEYED